jgi:hexosaminidase
MLMRCRAGKAGHRGNVVALGSSLLFFLLLLVRSPGVADAHYPALWPWPSEVYVDRNLTVPIDVDNFELACEVDNPCPPGLANKLDIYTKLIQHSCRNQVYTDRDAPHPPPPPPAGFRARESSSVKPLNQCVIQLATADDTLTIDSNSTFKVTIGNNPYPFCQIEAHNLYGAFYALQTVAQFCDTSGDESSLRIGWVIDQPRFNFRGLLIDSARHFLPVTYIKRIIDTMALLRYNVLHWHIVDSESFPVQSQTFPDLSAKGAWYKKAVYSTDDMKEVVQYAFEQGITVMPEFDIPGHGSWGMAYPDLMGCDEVLDPTNPDVYTFLTSFLKEMIGIFPSEYIFLGGDEVDSSCWAQNPKIAQWLADHDMTADQLFNYFWTNVTSEVLPKLGGRKVGVWQSDKLDIQPSLLPQDSFGNVWQSPKSMGPIINAGMKVVLSGTYYLDQENPITADASGHCKEYAWQQTWKCLYSEEPSDQLEPGQLDMLWGGMAAMWGEGVNTHDFEARVWTRAAAVAERLWRLHPIFDVDEATPRLEAHVCRLNLLGIKAGPIGPGFCMSDLEVDD